MCSVETGRAAVVAGYDDVVMENATLPDAMRHALIDALSSMQAEPGGWVNSVQPRILPERIRRLDNVAVRIDLDKMPQYRIDQPETLTLVIPPALVTSDQLVTAVFGNEADAAGLRIAPEAGNVSLHGSFTSHATRADVRSIGEYTLSLTLEGGEKWHPAVGLSDVDCMLGANPVCPTISLLNGFTTQPVQPYGWAAILGDGLTYLDVLRVDDYTLDISIDARYATYFVTSPETLSVHIPAAALQSDAPLAFVNALPIGVNETNGRMTLGGSFLQREYPQRDLHSATRAYT